MPTRLRSSICLVTGGAGFIGSHLAEALLAAGYRVRVLDNLSAGRREHLPQSHPRLEWMKGDLRREKDVGRAIRGTDYVFHLGAIRPVLRSVEDPFETHEANVTGTLRLLLAARDARVKRFIFSSSSAVYGETRHFPSQEKTPLHPESPYAVSKLAGEHYCRIFSSLYGLETVSLRYFNVFGPRQNPESRYSAVIPIFIECLLKKKPLEVHWDGRQSRDFCYVDNVVEANLLAMKARGVSGEAFNISSQEEYSVLEVLEHLKRILQVEKVTLLFRPKRPGDVRRTFADIRKARKRLGHRVRTHFEEGLRKTVEWFKKIS